MGRRKGRFDLTKNEEGEFELVLGNRQLVSVFLIVVVLLGVFFSMGYFVGRNSPAAPTDTATRPTTAVAGSPANNNSPGIESKIPSTTSPDTNNPPVETKPEPQQPIEAVEKPSPLSKDKRVDPRVEPSATPSVGEPHVGTTFLQVVATSRPDAELIGETLAKKGFHTVIAPGPNPALFRVLVGPLKDAPDTAETRVRLESAGFKNPYVRKY